MTWLRIDDTFASHPKMVALSDAMFRVWVRLLCYCATYPKQKGVLPQKWSGIVPGFTSKRCAFFVQNGLLDQDENGELSIHDFTIYNPTDPTAADRMRRLRERNSDRNKGVTVTEPRAQAAARVPSPTPKDKALAKNSNGSVDLPLDEGEGDSAYALVLLLAAVEGSDAVKAQLRSKVEAMALQPYALHSARDELAKAKANGKHIRSDKAYVLAILDRYVEPSFDEPEPEFETNEAA